MRRVAAGELRRMAAGELRRVAANRKKTKIKTADKFCGF